MMAQVRADGGARCHARTECPFRVAIALQSTPNYAYPRNDPATPSSACYG